MERSSRAGSKSGNPARTWADQDRMQCALLLHLSPPEPSAYHILDAKASQNVRRCNARPEASEASTLTCAWAAYHHRLVSLPSSSSRFPASLFTLLLCHSRQILRVCSAMLPRDEDYRNQAHGEACLSPDEPSVGFPTVVRHHAEVLL